ncbi:hypothetical protein SAMN05444000_12047 [Shimia gijangensis]|uniref:Uncharacterized protein n=1 Tax=Shimia gijangensis TaxID=1470563 RepID=A0A1M6Q695_9RHOB|nr:hypothetical protein [Shimia gijangensis]SHK15650.1 hypothetical protein SAMN05444000_12047 [Shimia gijangensis]
MSGGHGDDTFNIGGDGIVRISFRYNGFESTFENATLGAVVDLSTGTVSNDGFGGQDTITVIGSSARVEIEGTRINDSITGSSRDERFILHQGDDTLDAGDGWDMIRYDRSGVGSVNINLATGQAFGIWEGQGFNHSISGVEEIRGSREAALSR